MLFRYLAIVLAFAAPLSALAGPVKLTAIDGGFVVEGDLLSYSNELFRLQTETGPVTVDGGMVICSGAGCPDPVDLVAQAKVAGTAPMVHQLLPTLVEAFGEVQGLQAIRKFSSDQSVAWELRRHETNRLMAILEAQVFDESDIPQAMADDAFDIALSSNAAAPPIRYDVIALDALVPIVSPDNPRAMVTMGQLRAMLSGEIDNWSILGGSNQPVALHVPVQTLANGQGALPDQLSPNTVSHIDMTALADAVAAQEDALGLVPYSAIGNAVPLVITGSCGLASLATRDTIKADDYPFMQPVFLHRKGANQPKLVRDFIAFSKSAQVQPAIRSTGYVDQAIGRVGFDRQGDRIANAVLASGGDPDQALSVRRAIETLLGGDRLTATFRFEDGSSSLAPTSVASLRLLSEAISGGAFDGEELLFAGFSDGLGEDDANQRLSQRRAEALRKAALARVTDKAVATRSIGLGEVMPLACDDTPWGRQINRRVEVWVRPSQVPSRTE